MAIVNNVNASMLEQVAKGSETDKSKVRRNQRLEGEWFLEVGGS